MGRGSLVESSPPLLHSICKYIASNLLLSSSLVDFPNRVQSPRPGSPFPFDDPINVRAETPFRRKWTTCPEHFNPLVGHSSLAFTILPDSRSPKPLIHIPRLHGIYSKQIPPQILFFSFFYRQINNFIFNPLKIYDYCYFSF